jgi:hypothetical protein
LATRPASATRLLVRMRSVKTQPAIPTRLTVETHSV